MIPDRLVGFDARAPWTSLNPLWDLQRRRGFLLRIDVEKPLSTDILVWPSVFDSGQGRGLAGDHRQQFRLAGIPLPNWIGPNHGLWDDLDRMRSHLDENVRASDKHTVVAISWFSETDFPESGNVGLYTEPTNPPTPLPSWPLLGFDVSDSGLLSGLSNCGYSEDELPSLRATWGPFLNEHHLFIKATDAFAYRAVCD
jgi:hypothetical protein